MNQIPNIEKTMRRGIKLIAGRIEALHPQYFLDETTYKHDVKGTMDVVKGVMADIEETHHHQLQKARQDWLREEIVKLEGMKRYIESEEPFVPWYKPDGMSEEEYAYHIHNHEQKRARWEADCEWNQALDNVINRYNEELDQDKK